MEDRILKALVDDEEPLAVPCVVLVALSFDKSVARETGVVLRLGFAGRKKPFLRHSLAFGNKLLNVRVFLVVLAGALLRLG